MRIHPENAIGVCVDYQTKLVPAMSSIETLIHNSIILLKGLDVLEVPVLITEQYPRGLGATVAEIREASPLSPVLEKITFSCYESENFKAAIDASERKSAIVFGIESHVCVLETVIDLQAAGYQVYLVSDCIDSRHPADKAAALIRAQQEGAIITTYEAILFELTHIAGTDKFKQISKLVK